MLLSDSLTLSCTHTPLLCVVASQTKGLSGSTGLRGSPRSLLLLWLCRGEGTGLLMGAGWDLWIFWSGELRLEQEGSCELKSRGLVALLGVDMNLRLGSNLGCFYRSGKGPTCGLPVFLRTHCLLHNGVWQNFP